MGDLPPGIRTHFHGVFVEAFGSTHSACPTSRNHASPLVCHLQYLSQGLRAGLKSLQARTGKLFSLPPRREELGRPGIRGAVRSSRVAPEASRKAPASVP
ncbi:Hypothetical protein AA314_08346 [Archangium gephyra]|uniref:Uncharacterized protein n=1 Tax=Archangium gephyra TaxID=48 RepID=A0AAC8TIE5_9BACT|nr:Hypothetical protein AA314_08346 [Archangium gephyra]